MTAALDVLCSRLNYRRLALRMAQPFCKICGIACNKRLGLETTALRYAFLALRPNPSRPVWVANPHLGLWRLSHYASSEGPVPHPGRPCVWW
jgi:hypothetical protein